MSSEIEIDVSDERVFAELELFAWACEEAVCDGWYAFEGGMIFIVLDEEEDMA